MNKCEKALYPVFLTKSEYTYVKQIPDNLLHTKESKSVIETAPNIHPYVGCPYFSFLQLSPHNPGVDGLSWVITPNTGQEVVQFLTKQIRYRIRWTLTAIERPTGDEKVTLLLVKPLQADVENKAYEPWDINGKRIVFTIPKGKGCFTQGEFVLPGYYSQFIIESPGYTLKMKLIIKGLVDSPYPDPWRPLQPLTNDWYCVKKGKKDCNICLNRVYTNFLDNVSGNTIRIVSDEYKRLQDRVREEFFANPRFPCFTVNNSQNVAINTFTMEATAFYRRLGNLNLYNSTNNIGYLFTLPSNICDLSSDVVALFDDVRITGATNLAQSFGTYFTLVKGSYVISISITLASVTWNNLDDNAKLNFSNPFVPPTPYTPTGVVKKRCENVPIQLKLLNNNLDESIFTVNLPEPSFVDNGPLNSFLETNFAFVIPFDINVITNCAFAVTSTVWSYETEEDDEVQVAGCNAEMQITIEHLVN